MTPSSDPRGARLRALDIRAGAFADAFPGQSRDARRDIETLAKLSDTISASLDLWARLCARLNLAAAAPFDPGRAGGLVLESVFDDLLVPGGWGVLRAALDLAQSQP